MHAQCLESYWWEKFPSLFTKLRKFITRECICFTYKLFHVIRKNHMTEYFHYLQFYRNFTWKNICTIVSGSYCRGSCTDREASHLCIYGWGVSGRLPIHRATCFYSLPFSTSTAERLHCDSGDEVHLLKYWLYSMIGQFRRK